MRTAFILPPLILAALLAAAVFYGSFWTHHCGLVRVIRETVTPLPPQPAPAR